MFKRAAPLVFAFVAATALVIAVEAPAQDARDIHSKDVHSKVDNACSAKPKSRAEAVRALLSHLGVGEGSAVADIGAGSGSDTWVFAEIVGEKGTVSAEEIVEGKVKALEKEAEKRDLSQVRAVLGRDNDPCLPPDSADLAFLHHVYHHIAKPREMLRGIWRALKPGGYLVVVDQRRGTLRDWVPRDVRATKHYWIAETTVSREAREEGFAFFACAEEHWNTNGDFVLVFQRPEELKSPGGDPDPFLPPPVDKLARAFLPLARPYERPVVVAFGEARKCIPPILQNSSGPGLEIVLEEWATQKEERPPLPPDVSFPSVLTDQGDPRLGPEPIDVVFFLDSYHLLFHGETLLGKLHEKLSPTGCIYVLDREAREPLSRREASHRRRIRPETVEQEMSEAGFFLWFDGPPPAPDRFLLVFGKAEPRDLLPEVDPFVAGPEIAQPPGPWLKENYWRLRGLKTADGRFLRLPGETRKGPVEIVSSGSPGEEIWRIPSQNVLLSFAKKNEGYLLTDYRFLEGR
jgi:predicted methyltransferase